MPNVDTTTTALNGTGAQAGVTRVQAKRIGLIGDDHNQQEDGSDLPAQVLEAFKGCDLIIHLGHMGVRNSSLGRGVLDRLTTVAPVLGVRDYSAIVGGGSYVTPADGARVAGLTRVIEAGGVRIGAVHNLEREPGTPIKAPAGGSSRIFNSALAAARFNASAGSSTAILVVP